jgi:hypothetical protein
VSVRIEQLGSHCKDFHEILYGNVFRKSVVKNEVSLNLTRMTGNVHEDRYTFLITSRSVRLRMRIVSNKIVEKIKTHIFCSIIFPENRAVYEVMWNNTIEQDRPQMKTWRMPIACWIPKATSTHSE